MSAQPSTSAAAPATEMYEATTAKDGSDAVDRGAKLTLAHAIARRQSGLDIVVCGPDTFQNCDLAEQIERAAAPARGKVLHHGPHLGSQSLPHWQQLNPPPPGHSFYETPARKARGKP